MLKLDKEQNIFTGFFLPGKILELEFTKTPKTFWFLPLIIICLNT